MGNAKSSGEKSLVTIKEGQNNQNNCVENNEDSDFVQDEVSDSKDKSISTNTNFEVLNKPNEKPMKAFTEPVRKLKSLKKIRLTNSVKLVSLKSGATEEKVSKTIRKSREQVPSENTETKDMTSQNFDDEIFEHLSNESKEKVLNINNLIEALDNFNKIFNKFPYDYNKLVKKILNYTNLNLKNPFQTGNITTSLSMISADNLNAIHNIISHLMEHSVGVQNMLLIMSRLEERIETTNQVLKSTLKYDEACTDLCQTKIRKSLKSKKQFQR